MKKKVLRFLRERRLNSFQAKNDDDVVLCGRKKIGDLMAMNGLSKTYPELSDYDCITRCDVVNTDDNGCVSDRYQIIICIRTNEDGSCLVREFKLE
jgi:hypothetical protein